LTAINILRTKLIALSFVVTLSKYALDIDN